MRFEKIPRPQNKGLLVAQRLLEEFRRSQVEPGGRLPPERELAERLGVSRTVVREALSALQMAGVVESRVGDGTYITETFSPGKPGLPPLLKNLDASVSVVEAMQAREALDISAGHLAIENAKDGELAVLDDIVATLCKAIDGGEILRYLELTLDLHIAIAKAGGNGVLEQAVVYLIDLIKPHLWVVAQNYDQTVMEESLSIHVAMVDGIKNRDLKALIAAVQKHYRDYPSLQQ